MSDAITLQSTTAANTPGNGWSIAPAVSLNGRWLTFASDSTNLGVPDPNGLNVIGGLNVIYLKDTQSGALTPISLSSTGKIPNSNSTTPVLSDDGRYVAFQSYANNMTGTDNNNDSDIFWKDTQTGTLKLLSGSSGTAGNNASGSPAISTDGRYVVFQSYADNLANNDTNGAYDIYLADAQTGTVTPVSINTQNSFGDQNSVSPSVSANGQIVAFASDATNLVTNDKNGNRDVFVKNMQTGAVTLVSANVTVVAVVKMPDGTNESVLASGRSDSPALSADGNNVAFLSSASDWGKATNDNYNDIFVKNLVSNTIKLVSADSAGQQANDNSWSPVIDNTGKYVAFLSDATNLVSGDTNGFADIFVKEISTGKIARISADSVGGQIYRGPELNKAISISNDGQWIFFSATSSTSNGANEVFKVANPLGIDPNPNRIVGTPGNDTFSLTARNEIVDGLAGTDTAVFTGTRTGHTITKTPTAGLTVSSVTVSSSADGTDTLSNVERLKFSDSGLAFDLISPNSAGGIYRLYGATFNRTPDLGGLGYWIDQADKGKSAVAMALDFVYSQEFKTLYAAKIVDNYATGDDITKLVTGFYKNVLHREPDAGGRDYYVGQITSHSKTVGQVLAEISDSNENITSLTGVMENGVVYTPWV